MADVAADYRVEPSGRDDEWAFHVVRISDGCIVGHHLTRERAQAFADNGAEPVLTIADPIEDDDQLDMFGRAA